MIQPYASFQPAAKFIRIEDPNAGPPQYLPVFFGSVGQAIVQGLTAGGLAPVSGEVMQPPFDASQAYNYGLNVDGSLFFRSSGAALKCYLVNVTGDRLAGYAVTGDSNDALIKISGNNYAANDANFILRALNGQINNRSGGVLGTLDNNLGAQNKSGGTVTNVHGLTVTGENYGAVTEIGAAAFIVKNEGTGATSEYGILIDSENAGSGVARAGGPAIKLKSGGAQSLGWDNIIDATAATLKDQGGNVVNLFTFKDQAGNTKVVSYTVGAVALVVG